jgi:hypothetical protein
MRGGLLSYGPSLAPFRQAGRDAGKAKPADLPERAKIELVVNLNGHEAGNGGYSQGEPTG